MNNIMSAIRDIWYDLTHERLLTWIQIRALFEVCPNCKHGHLHTVDGSSGIETCLWCNSCDLSMDSSGGYIV